ncbi:glycosyltransferase [Streptomyces sp. NP160]|uniref:glycosyltransferase n=1 Tax=Streptomyces sp. NP160 TaxID=2586637 RepID=UPI001118D264|nr:glycosyltransferase [Streptomyces sp. NP160]TNM61074.1 glycosyltransferase [Streptomyces sp. NP160]
MSTTPQVSVVLPVFDDEEHLPAALERLLRQRSVDLEVVVVDDGSRDGSLAAARAVAAREPRVRVVALPENRGVARARERGVAESRAEHVWFVDSDDDWPDDAAATLLDTARSCDADVVVAAAVQDASGTGASRAARRLSPPQEGGSVSGERALRWALTGRITGHLWNKLFRRELLLAVEVVPATTQSDLPTVLGALARAQRVAFTGAVVYEYRLRPGSVITSARRRAASLALIGPAVERALVHSAPHLSGSPEHRYFTTRYLLLSGIKDALSGAYPPDESARAASALRRQIGWQELTAVGRQRDPRRLALAAAARASLPLYRRLLRVAAR